MKGFYFNPDDPQVKNLFTRFSQIDKNLYGIGARISPSMASRLSQYKAIRRMSHMDLIDIVCKKNGKKRSILYIPPPIKIKKVDNHFVIDLSKL